jgi:hypothetical protein
MRDATVVLKYEISAIRNSDFLTGQEETCIFLISYRRLFQEFHAPTKEHTPK